MMLRFGISNHDETKVLPSMHITSLFARIFRKHCSTKAFGNSVFGFRTTVAGFAVDNGAEKQEGLNVKYYFNPKS